MGKLGRTNMSMCVCENCDAYIDSDDDPDCFVEIGNMRRLNQTMVLCENCRDKLFAELEAEQDAADAACAEAERQSNTGESQ